MGSILGLRIAAGRSDPPLLANAYLHEAIAARAVSKTS
jgi:hypothetical protein